MHTVAAESLVSVIGASIEVQVEVQVKEVELKEGVVRASRGSPMTCDDVALCFLTHAAPAGLCSIYVLLIAVRACDASARRWNLGPIISFCCIPCISRRRITALHVCQLVKGILSDKSLTVAWLQNLDACRAWALLVSGEASCRQSWYW